MKTSRYAIGSLFVVALALVGCNKGEGSAELVRVKVPEAKCEVAIPANMEIVDAKASGFWIVEKGKNAKLDGMLISMTPVGPMGDLAPPGSSDVKVDKDEKNPDGSAAREGSYKTSVQSFFVAEYAYPISKESWLHCNIKAAKAEDRDSVAKLCRTLAPKAL
ncbi:hypothetical protein [Polyangium spumosum]|uniref:Uncharacterized protein n=1 Tax=Polyangium spumosum TaxID=889282 RepID=A0A6N7Q5N8_9BACT|nr:hypothetical protein [Polyangium spumosum]MRG96161.1 hypothetical protein [Polyangium spumosum]